MGFKKIESKIGFAELALSSSMAKNRSLKTLEQMNNVIDWTKIENILMKYYKVGTSNEGADAYRQAAFNISRGLKILRVATV